VNGHKVQRAPLAAGDKLKIGRIVFDVRTD
jgi:hypothetical protein